MVKAAFNKKKTLFTSKLDLNLRKKLVKCYIWSVALYGALTWTLRAADHKYLESFEMWWWRSMGKISWTDRVRNEEVLLRVKEQRNILHEIRKRKSNWIGHILRRNCLLKQVIEGKIKGEMEVKRRRGRRRRKLLDDLKYRRGYSHLKEEALDRTMWRNRFGGGFEPVVRQNTEWMNELWQLCRRPWSFTCEPCSFDSGRIGFVWVRRVWNGSADSKSRQMPGAFRHTISQRKSESPAEIHKQIVAVFGNVMISTCFFT